METLSLRLVYEIPAAQLLAIANGTSRQLLLDEIQSQSAEYNQRALVTI